MKTTAPLTKTQYGLYVECLNYPGEPYYDAPFFYILDGNLDEERRQRTHHSRGTSTDLVSLNEYFEREHITHTFMPAQVGYHWHHQ